MAQWCAGVFHASRSGDVGELIVRVRAPLNVQRHGRRRRSPDLGMYSGARWNRPPVNYLAPLRRPSRRLHLGRRSFDNKRTSLSVHSAATQGGRGVGGGGGNSTSITAHTCMVDGRKVAVARSSVENREPLRSKAIIHRTSRPPLGHHYTCRYAGPPLRHALALDKHFH